MGRHWQMLFGLGASVLLAGYAVSSLVGCSNASTSTSRPAASTLPEGLTILEAKDPAWGMNAAYVRNGRVVYIESRLGPQKPEVYRQDSPDEPANEMDLRFVDQSNRTFFAQRGGDSWIDPTWGAEISKSLDPRITPAERELDWSIAHEAAAALPQQLGTSFKDHNYHLNVFTTIPSPANDPIAKSRLEDGAKLAPREAQLAYGTYNNGSWNELYYAKYSKGAGCFAWVCGGSHSAVQMNANPNVGYWVTEINACNHGTCPGASGISYDCYGWNGGGWFSSVAVNGSTAGGADGWWDGQGGCQTAYNWDSGSGSHLCNDDAVGEMYGIDNGTQVDSVNFSYQVNGHCRGSLCGGGSPAHYACECSGGKCSGDWNTPNCF